MVWPEVARIPCKVCKEYSVDFIKGEVNTYEDENGDKLPVLRHGTPTPCESCPRKGPENEDRLILSNANARAWDFHNRARATPGMQSALFNCPTTQRNFALIDNVLEQAKADYAEKIRKRQDTGDE